MRIRDGRTVRCAQSADDERSYAHFDACSTCGTDSPKGWVCSRPEGHAGRHVAWIGKEMSDPRPATPEDEGFCDAWPNTDYRFSDDERSLAAKELKQIEEALR